MVGFLLNLIRRTTCRFKNFYLFNIKSYKQAFDNICCNRINIMFYYYSIYVWRIMCSMLCVLLYDCTIGRYLFMIKGTQIYIYNVDREVWLSIMFSYLNVNII